MVIPEKFADKNLRQCQKEFLDVVPEVFASGRKVLFAELPTGAGKTCCGLRYAVQEKHRTAYCTITRPLQGQIAEEWPEVRSLMGMSNYPTEKFPDRSDLSCDDCDKTKSKPCSWCYGEDSCPYRVAKREAENSDHAILNFAIWLSLQNYADKSFGKPGRSLVICDEADMVEEVLLNFIGLEIPAYRLEEWGMQHPGDDPSVWNVWLLNVLQHLKRALGAGESGKDYLRMLKENKAIARLAQKVLVVLQDLGSNNWVVTQQGDYKKPVIFRPIRVDQYAKAYMFQHADRFIFMSGTIGDPAVLARSLGLGPKDWWFLSWPSTIPKEYRPVYLWYAATLNKANEAREFPKICKRAVDICRHHNGERGIIHTVSYDRAQKVVEYLQNHGIKNVISYRTDDREEAERRYIETPGAVMVAQSMERGFNGKDELCRFTVSTKAPWLDLGNPQIKARYESGDKDWYQASALNRFVQMHGRGNRHDKDHCANYALDGSTDYLMSNTVVPQYFLDAIVRTPPEWAVQ